MGGGNEVIAALGSGLVTFLITWGATRGKVQELERRVDHLEQEQMKHLDLIHSLREIYVSQQHFNDIMSTMKESHRELKEDVKKVLELLSTSKL